MDSKWVKWFNWARNWRYNKHVFVKCWLNTKFNKSRTKSWKTWTVSIKSWESDSLDSSTGNKYLLPQRCTSLVVFIIQHFFLLIFLLNQFAIYCWILTNYLCKKLQSHQKLSMQKCYGLNFVYILFQPLDREIVFSCIVFRLRFNNVIFIQGKWCGGERAKAVLSTETLSAGLSLPKRKVSGFIF